MSVQEAQRRARARRALRQYQRVCASDREEIGFPSGIVGRLAHKWLNRNDRRDGGPFG